MPVTLKMRMGWDDNSLNAPDIAKIAEDAGIKMITVHGRTRCQFYTGSANWQFISKVKDAVKVPVIANGDIKCFDSATEALKLSGADGIMIGRGCYGKPWLIAQVAHYLETGEKLEDISYNEKLQTVLAHYDAMLEHYGEENGTRISRKHLGWYSSGMRNSGEFRASINRMNDSKEVREKIQEFYESCI